MKQKILLTSFLFFITITAFAQSKKVDDLILKVYKLFINQSVNVKDSLAIYALNFQISISKKNNKAVVTAISANDNLAFSLFPSCKKIFKIDFGPIMKNQKKINLIFPILFYGASPEKTKYTDEKGKALISLEAAAQAAYALYNPSKYHNIPNGKIADKASNMNNSLYQKMALGKQ